MSGIRHTRPVNPTIADVNWLLSSLAQSSAALVAIVGGLLVSRYVTLHAEQQAAGRRVADLKRRRAEVNARRESAQTAIDEYRVDGVLDNESVFEEITRRSFKPSSDQVLAAADALDDNLAPDVLERRLEVLSREIASAVTTLGRLVPESEEQAKWDDFRRQHELPIGHRGAWSWVYERMSEDREETARKARLKSERSQRDRFSSLAGLAASQSLLDLPIIRNPQVTAIRRLANMQQEQSSMQRLLSQRDTAEAEARQIEQARRLAEENYQSSRQPEGFTLALQVLTVMAILGIGVPVLVMGNGAQELPGWGRGAVIAAFFVGLALLLRFLFVYANYLSDGGRRDSLPSNVAGLLRRK